MVDWLLAAFPGLARNGCIVTSPPDQHYNCIVWVVGDNRQWWWPTPADFTEAFWPKGIAREETVPAFRDAFISAGFVECQTDHFETGHEKIALFANDDGVPLHSSRQCANGRWTSKMGELEDIEHELHDLEGESKHRLRTL